MGLPPLGGPTRVQLDVPRIELGRKLFFDRRLSFNGTMSCAMCHVPEEGFTSHASQTGMGIEGKSLRRNAPSLLNVAWQSRLFHDGRESSLVTQAWMPLLHPDEMANASIGQVLERLRGLPDYGGLFESAFAGSGASMQTLGEAMAAFEMTLVAADSRFDRWRYGGDTTALSAVEQQGFGLFSGKAGCTQCHSVDATHALLADGLFHATGAGQVATAGSRSGRCSRCRQTTAASTLHGCSSRAGAATSRVRAPSRRRHPGSSAARSCPPPGRRSPAPEHETVSAPAQPARPTAAPRRRHRQGPGSMPGRCATDSTECLSAAPPPTAPQCPAPHWRQPGR